MNLIKTWELETGGGTTQPDSGEGGDAVVKSEQPQVIGNQPDTAPSSQKAGADFVLPLMILVLVAFKGVSNCRRN